MTFIETLTAKKNKPVIEMRDRTLRSTQWLCGCVAMWGLGKQNFFRKKEITTESNYIKKVRIG